MLITGIRDREAERETGKVRDSIKSALTMIEQYLETLRMVPILPALRPRQSQYEAHHRRMAESMARTMKEAERKSIFYNLFARSTLLYGKKSIDYIHAGNSEPQRTETPLSIHSVEMDFPRMDNIDPYGLDYMLRVFRVEKFNT